MTILQSNRQNSSDPYSITLSTSRLGSGLFFFFRKSNFFDFSQFQSRFWGPTGASILGYIRTPDIRHSIRAHFEPSELQTPDKIFEISLSITERISQMLRLARDCHKETFSLLVLSWYFIISVTWKFDSEPCGRVIFKSPLTLKVKTRFFLTICCVSPAKTSDFK